MRTVVVSTQVVLLALFALAGCKPKASVRMFEEPVLKAAKDYEAPLPPGQLALRKITDPQQVPDFTAACGDLVGLRLAVDNSLDYLAKPSSQKAFPYGEITHAQAAASLAAFAQLLDSAPTASQFNEAVRSKFDAYISVGCDGKGTVLFTGYYTPVFDASRTRTARFTCPLYSPPPNLVKLPDGSGSPAVAMPDRRTIEQTRLFAGNELVWLADPFEAYVVQVQGSARLRMTDGTVLTVGYAANNGHDYVSVRDELAKDGKIGKRDGLGAMISYFKAHPAEVTDYTWRNPRFVFFSVTADGRPRGCLNEPVTIRRTIATDKKIFPPGCLSFVSTTLPASQGANVADAAYTGFALDQDAGGAIRAAGRCDVYLGVGAEAADLAGRTQNEGRLYYLFLKPSLMTVPALQPTAAPPPR